MAHPPDAVKPTPWGEQPHFYTSEATMSGRYTWECDDDGDIVVYDRETHGTVSVYRTAELLNRLASEVETLRELLRDCQSSLSYTSDADLRGRIDAALATRGETP